MRGIILKRRKEPIIGITVDHRSIRVPRGLGFLTQDQIDLAISEGYATVRNGILIPTLAGGSRQFWSETLAWATVDGTAVANSTTETIIFPDVTIPGNYLQDGRTLRFTVRGRYSTTGTPSVRFRFRWGGVAGTIFADSSTIVGGSTVTTAMWKIAMELTVRSNGATGTVFAMGDATLYSATGPTVGSATGAPGSAAMGSAGITGPAAVTLALNTDTALSITALWSAASASNTLTGHNYVIEALN